MKLKGVSAFFLALVICFSILTPSASAYRDTSREKELALDLKSLSLFKGVSETEFDLNRAPTRTEAVVMLIRVLGKENEALNGSWSHPFKEVSPWAEKYVGYAYQKGLVKGVTDTLFGSGNATASTYLTFILRALGYSDDNGGDFTWNDPYTLAKSLNILSDRVDTSNFLRADVVLISYSALPAKLKGSAQALSDKLISDGVFSQQQYAIYYDADALKINSNKTALSAEEIYSKCAPAVFYIEVFDKNSKPLATGSGFFIDSMGTAVTNYHVIKGAASAKIKIANTGAIYNVAGVYDYNTEQDWAVLKVDGSDFAYLKRGDAAGIIGGATVYAIGSPLGLESTITQGLISNAKRTEGNVTYIQISAAISSGSCGGALIDKYGEVIGITSASFVEGQNINLALPMSYLSNISTASVKPLTEVNGITVTTPETSSPIYLNASETNVTLNTGYSKTIKVTWMGGNQDDSIYWDSSNKNVATATWGDWIDNNTCELTINGDSPGTAVITVFVDSKHKCTISVTVGTANAYDILCEYAVSKGYQAGTSGYSLIFTEGDNTYFLHCDPKNRDKSYISCDLKYNDSSVSASVRLYGDNVYYSVDQLNPYNTCSGYLTKKSFCSQTILSPTNVGGTKSTEFNSLCTSSICQLLKGTNAILIKYKIPLTIKDLGFDAYYNEMS